MRASDEGSVVALVARYPGRRELDGDWDDAAVTLPEGRWTDILTGRRFNGGGPSKLAIVFSTLPTAVLRRAPERISGPQSQS